MMEPIKFEIRRIAVRGWSVATQSESMLTIFCCPEKAKEYVRVAARGRRAVLTILDADGSQLSIHKINAGVRK
jgi:hypothetical protein